MSKRYYEDLREKITFVDLESDSNGVVGNPETDIEFQEFLEKGGIVEKKKDSKP